MATILAVDDENGIRDFMAETLAGAGHTVVQAADAAEALRSLEDRPFDVMILDLRMPGQLGGMDVLRRARAEWPSMQIIVSTAYGSIDTAVEAMRIGAFDFLQKPIAGPDELRRLIARAVNWRAAGGTQPRGAGRGMELAADAVDAPDGQGPQGVARRFLWQLKRRHVYNVAATYAAVAFIALQVAELILPAVAAAPAWSYTALVILTIAGFPVALVLGWIFDLTAAGIRRTSAARTGGEQ
jgi:DNA-binding NtrC family response regulator